MGYEHQTGVNTPTKGQVNTATTLGALGTGALALLLLGGGGCGNGLFGLGNKGGYGCGHGHGYGHGHNCCDATKWDVGQSELMAALSAKIGSLEAINCADRGDMCNYKELMNAILGTQANNCHMNNELQKEIGCLKTSIAVEQAELCSLKKELMGALALESERRCCGDKSLYEFVKGTYVPGKLIMPADSICPPVMERFNTWVAPTTEAGA